MVKPLDKIPLTAKKTSQRERLAQDIKQAIDECMRYFEITGECFEYDKDFSPAEWFKDQYGIMRDSESGVENIIIRAYGREAYYMRDLPLHHSQTIIDETSEYTDFGLMIVVSDDFLTPLLSRGAAIKVMEPKWPAEKVKEMHIMATKLYDE